MPPISSQKPAPAHLRPFGIKLPAKTRDALFTEAAQRTSATGRHVSAADVARHAIADYLARLARRRDDHPAVQQLHATPAHAGGVS